MGTQANAVATHVTAMPSELAFVSEPDLAILLRARLGRTVVIRPLARASEIGESVPRGMRVVIASTAPLPWRLVERLAGRDYNVILVPVHRDNLDEERAIDHGAMAYLPLDLSEVAFRSAMTAVTSGEPAFSRAALGKWLQRHRGRTRLAEGDHGLTQRQRQILTLIAAGRTDKEIARTIGIAETTVHKHVSRLLKRTGASNRAAAVSLMEPRRVEQAG